MGIKNTLKNTLLGLVAATTIGLSSPGYAKPTEKEFVGIAPEISYTVIDHDLEFRMAVLGANTLIGCLKSGIGSYMEDKGFLHACAKGALGGTVAYVGEELATYNTTPFAPGAGKLIHDLGISMQDNIFRGEDILSQYQTELGPVTLTFEKGIIPGLSLTFTPALGIVESIIKGYEFDTKKSLSYLTPVFIATKMPQVEMGDYLGYFQAYTTGNVIVYNPETDLLNLVLSHEINHTLFWSKSRWAKHTLNWIPTEKIHKDLSMENIQSYFNLGQDFLGNMMHLPFYIDSGAYYYEPIELEALSMQRDK